MGAYEIRARSATTHLLSYQLAYGGCPKSAKPAVEPSAVGDEHTDATDTLHQALDLERVDGLTDDDG